MMLYGTRTTLRYSSAVLQTGAVEYSTSGQPPTAVALMGHSSRSFDRWLLSHWRFFVALSAGSSASGTSRTSASLLALSTGPLMSPALWQVPWGSRSLRVTPKFRLTSTDSCSGGALLALVRPVVPYTLVLLSALSAGCLPSFLPQGGSSPLLLSSPSQA